MTMSTKKPKLGRGLDALLGSAIESAASAKDELRHMPVDLLQRGKSQPRTHMGEAALQELSDSIKAQGVVQPIVVRPIGAGRYEIVAGERRWRAAQLAGLHSIPAGGRAIPDGGEMLEQGKLDMGHARALLALSGKAQSEAARQVAGKGLSVRETEHLVRRLLERPHTPKSVRGKDPDIRALEERLSDKLGARVHLLQAGAAKGKLVIEYNSMDELDGILPRTK